MVSLVGRWGDTKGSLYEVSVDDDSKATIRTTRPHGKVLVTPGLVRTDSKSGCIIWGRRGSRSYWLSDLGSRSLKWERQPDPPFVWHRVGECPVRPKSWGGASRSTVAAAQGKQSGSQKGACSQEDDRSGRLHSTVAQGKQSGSQKGTRSQEDDRSAAARRMLARAAARRALARSLPAAAPARNLAPPPLQRHRSSRERSRKRQDATGGSAAGRGRTPQRAHRGQHGRRRRHSSRERSRKRRREEALQAAQALSARLTALLASLD